MKILRFNESLNVGTPEVGDYVIAINDLYVKDSKYDIYINNTIGKIYSLNDNYPNDIDRYLVEYENFPGWKYHESNQSRYLLIKYWSKNKEELESILQANKFNI